MSNCHLTSSCRDTVLEYLVKKGKGTKIYIAPHRENLTPKLSGMDHTAFTLQIHHTCLYLVSVHQTAPPLVSGSSHLITAYYSFINPMRMKVGLVS